ncbi:hypothetical protein ACEUZ9_002766 [Paracoccus litorisediminis]|uniref:hypothetical protein n=1 Tax=Paracoccus litorisediminis TaxID=2006130 RepID=UPI00372FB4B8
MAGLDDAVILVLRARYLGIRAVRAMQLAIRLEHVPGMSYRSAAKHVANVAVSIPLLPSMDDMFRRLA